MVEVHQGIVVQSQSLSHYGQLMRTAKSTIYSLFCQLKSKLQHSGSDWSKKNRKKDTR